MKFHLTEREKKRAEREGGEEGEGNPSEASSGVTGKLLKSIRKANNFC